MEPKRKNDVVKAMENGRMLEALWKAANILEHTLHCWEAVENRAGDDQVLRAMAQGQIESLRIDCDQIYKACEKLKGRG